MASSSKTQKRSSNLINRPSKLLLHTERNQDDADTTELPKNGRLPLPVTPATQGSILLSPNSATQSPPRPSLRRARSDLDTPLSPLPSRSFPHTFSRNSRLSATSSFTSTPPYSPSKELFPPSIGGSEGSMMLYRLASTSKDDLEPLIPPGWPNSRRSSGASAASSTSGDSESHSPSPASSSPLGTPQDSTRGLVPYPYDPLSDTEGPMDEEDLLHDPETDVTSKHEKWEFPWRGVVNLSFLVFLVLALLALFAFYPMLRFYRDKSRNDFIIGNIRINATGQNDSI